MPLLPDDLFGDGKTAIKVNASKYIASAAAGYAGIFNGMTYSTQTRAWIDLDRNKSLFDAAGNIQFGEVFGGTSNFGGITSRPDPDLLRGYNWEYNATVQHQLMDRLSMTAGFYRRQFSTLTSPTTPTWRSPTGRPSPLPRPPIRGSPDSGSAITMHSLNAAKVGVATDNLPDVLGRQHLRLQRLRSERQRAVHQAAAVRRHHHRSPGHDVVRRARQPEQRALLRRRAALPHHVQDVGRLSTAV